MLSGLYIFFSFTITREGGIRIRVNADTVAYRIAALLGSLVPDFLNLILFVE